MVARLGLSRSAPYDNQRAMANVLTVGRTALVAPFAALFFLNAPWAMQAALVLFAIAALTDLFDGMVARARKETSALGAALDPLADKLLVAAAMILLVMNGVISGPAVVAALVIVIREILVAGLREALALRANSLPVTRLAKWKTAFQMIAVAALIAGAPGGFAPDLRGEAGVLWIAAALTFWTGADYAWRSFALLGGKTRADR
jgi:CDP-diacylglycerol--glycerol-3-phosphate 3-phosphatidyltransferase